MNKFLLYTAVLCQITIYATQGNCQTSESNAGDTAKEPAWTCHFQETVVDQAHPAFPANYSGLYSLTNGPENDVSVTTTIFLGAHLWQGAAIYFNPEMSGGNGFTATSGIAGFPNGEVYRVSNPAPIIFLARLYGQFSFDLSENKTHIDDDQNQLAGTVAADRLVVTLGRFSITDFFDDNTYSHEPRTQFLNWSLMDNGAWDYPADTRGYTVGLVAELIHSDWAFRTAVMMVSTQPNGDTLDTRIGEAHGLVAEYEHTLSLGGMPGKVRGFVFENVANAGSYTDVLNSPQDSLNVLLTRKYGTIKYGGGIGFEQQFASDLGGFMRAGWSDGQTETWMYTAIDRSISVGAVWKGISWHRPDDAIGIAGVMNGLSRAHEQYLAAGGYDFNIGDGKLNYAPESIIEIYYNALVIPRWLQLAFDYQFCANPAYNMDRGPVNIFGLRAHVEL